MYLHFDNNPKGHHNRKVNDNHNKSVVGLEKKKRREVVLNQRRLVSQHNRCSTFPFLTSVFRAGGCGSRAELSYPRTPEASPHTFLLCPFLDSHLDLSEHRTSGPASSPTCISTRAQGSLYKLHIYMAKIETHGITCICKSANQTPR